MVVRQGKWMKGGGKKLTKKHCCGILQLIYTEMTQVLDVFSTSPPIIIADLFDVLENFDQSHKKKRGMGRRSPDSIHRKWLSKHS